MRKFITANAFTSVGAGQTATIDLPVGDRIYHALHIIYKESGAYAATADLEAAVTAIRVKVNGKVQRRASAAEINAINAFNGKAAQAGLIPIFLSEPWRRTAKGEDALGWGMSDVNTFQIEVDIDAAATAPTLEFRALVESGRRALGPIVKWRKFRQTVAATGLVQTINLPKTDAYLRLHAFEASNGDITAVEVVRDNSEIVEASRTDFEDLLANYEFAPQSAVFSIPFDITNRVGDALAMVNGQGQNLRRVSEFRIDWTMGAASSFDLLTEVLGPAD